MFTIAQNGLMASNQIQTIHGSPHWFPICCQRPSPQDSLKHSPEKVKSAIKGQRGVVAAGSVSVSPPGGGSRGGSESGSGSNVMYADVSPAQRLRFQGLTPHKRYTVALCTESNSGTLSKVVAAEADSHAEAPLVSPVYLIVDVEMSHAEFVCLKPLSSRVETSLEKKASDWDSKFDRRSQQLLSQRNLSLFQSLE